MVRFEWWLQFRMIHQAIFEAGFRARISSPSSPGPACCNTEKHTYVQQFHYILFSVGEGSVTPPPPVRCAPRLARDRDHRSIYSSSSSSRRAGGAWERVYLGACWFGSVPFDLSVKNTRSGSACCAFPLVPTLPPCARRVYISVGSQAVLESFSEP